MKEFITLVLPYITIIIFLVGMSTKFYKWFKLKNPSMTLFPRPEHGDTIQVLKETFFFPGIYKSDKPLWVGAWLFHVLLVLIFIGHLRVFFDLTSLWNLLNMNEQDVNSMSATVGGLAGILIMILTIYLITRRFYLKRVRQITGFGDHFALLLIISIIITGNLMRFGEHFDLKITHEYFSNLFLFSGIRIPDNPNFLVHFFLAQLLIMYIPFSKILHFGGIFFSQKALRRN